MGKQIFTNEQLEIIADSLNKFADARKANIEDLGCFDNGESHIVVEPHYKPLSNLLGRKFYFVVICYNKQ